VLLTAPTAPVTLNFGMKMPSWYDIKSLDVNITTKFEEVTGVDEIHKNTERIREVLKHEIELLGGDSTKVFIGGFSQGCAMALHVGLTFEEKLGGIMGFSGYLFPITKEHEANAKTPIFSSHGKDDPLIPFDLSCKSYEPLKDHEITKCHESSLGHSINGNILESARDWFKKCLGKK